MSVRVMADVWDSALEDPVQVAVLLVVANYANDQGENAYPGNALIARKTRYSERTVVRTIAELERDGWLTAVQRGGGRPKGGDDRSHKTIYRVNLAKLKGCQAVTVSDKSKRVTATTGKGDTGAKKGDSHDNPPHPLLGRSVLDPSLIQFPPTPASGGGSDREAALERGVDQVCSALGIANRRKRRLLGDVISMAAEKGEPVGAIATAMIAAWNYQHEHTHLLHRKFGIEKFFGLGIWRDMRRLLWNEEMLRQQATASVGSGR